MKIQCVTPVLQVSDLELSVRFYRDVLGFTENFRTENYAVISRSDTQLHLCRHLIHERPVGGSGVRFFCDEVADFYQEITEKGAVVKAALENRPYGLKDFTIADPDGNRLTFSCDFRKA